MKTGEAPSLLSTREFAMSRRRYFLTMLLHDTPWLAVAFLIFILVMGIAGALISWWYCIIFVALALVVIPFVITVPFLHFSFKPLTTVNVTPHTLHSDSSRLHIRFPESDRSLSVPLDTLGRYRIFNKGVVIPSLSAKEGWLWLPLSAFDTPQEMTIFLKRLYSTHNENNGSDSEQR